MDSAPVVPAALERDSRRKLFLILKLVVSVALLYVLLRNASVSEIFRTLGSTNLGLFLVALGFYLLRIWIGALRWSLLLRPLEVRASPRFLFRSNLIAAFFSNFLPTIIGGDPVRVYDSWRLGAGKAGAVSVVFLDRFLGLVALIVFAVLGMAASKRLVDSLGIPFLELWTVVGMLLMFLLLWIVFHPTLPVLDRFTRSRWASLGGLDQQASDSLAPFGGRSDILGKSFALSLLLQLAIIAHYVFLAASLSLPVPAAAFLVIAPLAILVMMLPISINAIGLRENVFVFFFALYGVPSSQSIAFAWLALAILLLVGVAGGILLATRREGRVTV
jgi:uncharacterized membrane protein YbhN (UPF0104 family)